jgi:hypothetical protein
MNAEMSARVTAARAVDADCAAAVDASIDSGGPEPHWAEMYFRICTEMRAVLGELAALEQRPAAGSRVLADGTVLLDSDDFMVVLSALSDAAEHRSGSAFADADDQDVIDAYRDLLGRLESRP